MIQSYAKEAKKGLQLDVCSSAEDVDEDKDKDETETVKQVQDSEMYDGNGVPESIRSDASDQEEDEESESGPVAISLSKAETQALTNYGSGEDENEDEEIEFEEGPVDVQTSLQASSEPTTENEQTSNQELSKTKSSEILSSESVDVKGEQDVAPHYLSVMEDTPLLTVNTPESFITANMKTEESSSSLPVNETQTLDTTCVGDKSAASSESSMAGSPDTESPVLVNEYEAGSGNVSQKSDEDDFVKVEDLPLKLAVYSEADLMKKMATEAQTNSLSDELLDGGEAQDQELVGDAQTLKEPETFGAQSA